MAAYASIFGKKLPELFNPLRGPDPKKWPVEAEIHQELMEVTCQLQDMDLKKELPFEAPSIKFKCGDMKFIMPETCMDQIPYLAAISSGNFQEKSDNNGVFNLDPSFCRPDMWSLIIRYIRSHRACYLCPNLEKDLIFISPTELFKMMDYFVIKRPQYSLDELERGVSAMWMPRTFKDFCNPNWWNRSMDKAFARDLAVIMCWHGSDIVKTSWDHERLDRMILGILKTPAVFHIEIRRFVMKWYAETFPHLTDALGQLLAAWSIKFPLEAQSSKEQIPRRPAVEANASNEESKPEFRSTCQLLKCEFCTPEI